MGCRSSCAIFERFSTALEWAAMDKAGTEGLIPLLDNFLLISSSKAKGYAAKKNFIKMCQMLGVPLAAEKAEGPVTCLGLQAFSWIYLPWKHVCLKTKKGNALTGHVTC